jgi:hypothetical protein
MRMIPIAAPRCLRAPWLLLLLVAGPVAADARDAPAFTVDGVLRARYEHLDGPFQPGARGSDHVLATWVGLRAEARRGAASAVLEVLDARATYHRPDTPLGTAIVNTLEPIQAHLRWEDEEDRARLGRMTLDFGSRRLVARNVFRNTTETFDGIDWIHRTGAGHWRTFAVAPVRRLPDDPASIQDNEFALDRSDPETLLFGLQRRLAPAPDLSVELYALLLRERDGGGWPTPDRRLATPGLRIQWEPAGRPLDFEFEAAGQFGRSRASARPEDERDLDHRAGFVHAEAGWHLPWPTAPRLALELDWASGDDDPDDGEQNRFDDLYSAVVGDLGPTGIFGAVRRANLRAATLRLEWRPRPALQLRSALRAVRLDEPRDAWVGSGLRDPSGRLGRDVGTHLDVRLRWRPPLAGEPLRSLQVDLATSVLFKGDFARRAEGALDGDDDALLTYLEVTLDL